MSSLHEVFIFLAAAVIAVPVSRLLGFGAVMGYLAAGMIIGPHVLNLVPDVDRILHFAEFGVVLLLFIIGLELQPSRLWALRSSIFAWGAIQLGLTTLIFWLAGLSLGLGWGASLLAGFTLSLSSTAFALQMLAERRELTTRHGRAAFSILLFQDIAVVPVLAILPLLAREQAAAAGTGWIGAAMNLLVIAAVLAGGRLVLRYFLRVVARVKFREILTATTLLIVIGMALLADFIGLSMALGAFLAGILLADSEFRHQLEADIEPFKGLLLGLFFIAVGMSVNIALIAGSPGRVFGAAAFILAVKGLVLLIIGRWQGMDLAAARKLALSISQGGEFAFVVFAAALASGFLTADLADILIVAVTLSMAATPVLLKIDDYFAPGRIGEAPVFDNPSEEYNPVIIAGFGRFGQITGRLLSAKRIPFTALEINPDQVDFVRRYGNKVFYGDASRLDLLEAAHADKASIFVLAIDEAEASLKTAAIVRAQFPHLAVYARARNRQHAYQLMELGVIHIRRETFASALEMAGLVLSGLGLPPQKVRAAVDKFREHDLKRLEEHRSFHTDQEKMIALTRNAAKELEELFASDPEVKP